MGISDIVIGGDLSTVSQFFHGVMNDDFLLISALTFFICEAAFTMLPIEKAKSKQAASLLIGGVLGALLMQTSLLDAFIQGVLAGGATTMIVAKFKKPSSVVVVDPPTTTSISGQPVAPITKLLPPSKEIAEHL